MKENFKLFVQLLYVILFNKKVKRERKEAEAKAQKIIDDKFLLSTKDLAIEFAQMHKACKNSNPTNYIQNMQPYFVMINNEMKQKNCDPIEAAMSLVKPKTNKSTVIWIYGTAAEMINNLPNGAKIS